MLSSKGTPYIEVDENTKMIFSSTTADPIKGYKFMVISSVKTTSVNTSGAKAKKKRIVTISEDNNFTVRLLDFKRSDSGGFPKGVISSISLNVIKKAIQENLDDDGYLRYDLIPVVNDILVETFNDENEDMDEDSTANESFDDIVSIKTKKQAEKIKLRPKKKIKSLIKSK
ncbi:MAG: hypothetical protein M0P14_00760 [Alkaliphilus sp.]|nr:hypothetical protein [Alkaliphilus sp.]